MLSPKSKGLFIEVGDFSILTATTSSLQAPLTIERLREYPVPGGWESFREHLQVDEGKKRRRHIPAHCSVYPASRFFRRHSVESAAKVKDPAYFPNLLNDQFQIDLSKNVAGVINAADGAPFSAERPVPEQKELLLCGALRAELDEDQETLVDSSIYPETLQLGTLSTLGGLRDYMAYKEIERPTMMLEIAPDNAYLFILRKDQVDVCRPIPYGLNVMFPIIREELGLKDDESARKLFYSNTFDFTEMGPSLLRRILKELQASAGFYEVQTGQNIGQICVTLLPENLKWIESVLSRSLGLESMVPDYRGWIQRWGVTAGSSVQLEHLDARWLGLISLMGNFEPKQNGAQEK